MAHPAARSITSAYVAACVLSRSVVLGEGELPKYKNHYYYITLYEPMTWTEANTQCQQLGGYLAEIDDQDEFDFITNNVLNSLGDSYPYTRIGAKWSGTGNA